MPKLPVAVGERRPVPVILQTDTGALSTGFFYTYVGAEPEEDGE